MHRRTSIPLSIGMTSLAVLAMAGTAHFETGPDISDEGNTLSVTGTLSGMEAREVVVQIQGRGRARITRVDPKGNVSREQVDHWKTVHVSGIQTIPASHVLDGRVPFSVMTGEPKLGSSKAAHRPSESWRFEATDVVFGSATIVVKQGDRVMLRQTLRP